MMREKRWSLIERLQLSCYHVSRFLYDSSVYRQHYSGFAKYSTNLDLMIFFHRIAS
jgi:hypothetical protein